jgi:polar amino acid transport system substrate-binding protein
MRLHALPVLRLAAVIVLATTLPAPCDTPFQVGIHSKPPYAIKADDGTWTGLAVVLWERIAAKAGLDFRYVEAPYEAIEPMLAEGSLDAAVGEFEVNPESEKVLDFTQPYLIASIAIAKPGEGILQQWLRGVGLVADPSFLQMLAAIIVVMLVLSILIWLAERRRGNGHFPAGPLGIGSALWFTIVTASTVGYGDKTPMTLAGRILTSIWMIIGVAVVSSFTAIIVSGMSSARQETNILQLSDLGSLECGVLKGSLAERILGDSGIRVRSFEDLETAMLEMERNAIQAVAGDRFTLTYLQREKRRNGKGMRIDIPKIDLRDAFIAIPLRASHPDYDTINQALLEVTSSLEWRTAIDAWLGPRGIP